MTAFRLLLCCLIPLVLGCTSFVDRATLGLNVAQKTLTSINGELAAVHRQTRDEAVDHAANREAAQAAAAAVHARFAPAWRAYTTARTWWIRVAAAVTGARLVLDAGGTVDEAVLRRELLSLGTALAESSLAAAPLTGHEAVKAGAP